MSRCPCLFCKSTNVREVLSLGRLPAVQGSPLKGEELGKELYGNFVLGACGECGHVYNCAVDSSVVNTMYFEGYTTALPQSPSIMKRFEDVAELSIGGDVIRDANVVEIGASDFSFSKILISHGARRVWAFEPSTLFSNPDSKIEHRKKYFDGASAEGLKGDGVRLVVVRHVLEHMTSPLECLELIQEVLVEGGHVYIEVPNLTDILEKQRVYDFFYEHVSYFTPSYVSRELNKLGFEVLRVSSLVENQHFGILAKKRNDRSSMAHAFDENTSNDPGLSQLIHSFEIFKDSLSRCLRQLGRVAIYGAGNHAIGVTNILHLGAERIQFLLDQNPLKAGKYSPGSHIPILEPTSERLGSCDGIIILASLHQSEIHSTLRKKFGFDGKIFGTHPVFEELN